MGLERRPTSGRIFNGSRLIVPGLPVSSSKIFQNNFGSKKGSDQSLIREYNTNVTPTPTNTPTPTPTPSVTPTNTPSPTPTPTQNINDAILITNDVYIKVGRDSYLRYEE
jgi:hypothetical protein